MGQLWELKRQNDWKKATHGLNHSTKPRSISFLSSFPQILTCACAKCSLKFKHLEVRHLFNLSQFLQSPENYLTHWIILKWMTIHFLLWGLLYPLSNSHFFQILKFRQQQMILLSYNLTATFFDTSFNMISHLTEIILQFLLRKLWKIAFMI